MSKITNPFSNEYIINAIKDEIEAKKHIAIKGYIRELVPQYKLNNKVKTEIEKLIKIEIQKAKSIS